MFFAFYFKECCNFEENECIKWGDKSPRCFMGRKILCICLIVSLNRDAFLSLSSLVKFRRKRKVLSTALYLKILKRERKVDREYVFVIQMSVIFFVFIFT